jgi:hypothetical protein
MNIIINLKKQNFNKEQIREILIEIINDILNDAKLSDISKSYNIEICDINGHNIQFRDFFSQIHLTLHFRKKQ